jgi:hypothetical protein
MNDQGAEQLIRQAIAGNGDALTQIAADVPGTDDPVLLVLAALLGVVPGDRTLLDRAAAAAKHRKDRQLVAIARAHLACDPELVDALARDHLVDFPASYLVAWVASGANIARRPAGGTTVKVQGASVRPPGLPDVAHLG